MCSTIKCFLDTHSPDSIRELATLGSHPWPGLWIVGNNLPTSLNIALETAKSCGWQPKTIQDSHDLVAFLKPHHHSDAQMASSATTDRPPLLLLRASGTILGARCASAAALLRAVLNHNGVICMVLGTYSPPMRFSHLFETFRELRQAHDPDTSGKEANWVHLGGLEVVKKRLRIALEWPRVHSISMTRLGVRASRGVLLHGPPGCGKTSLVRAVASAGGAHFISLSAADVFSCYLGDAERIMREKFAEARRHRPSVIFLDEIDAIAANRDQSAAVDVGARVLATLLTEMDGIASANGVVVVAATNRLEAVDAALRRPGRFDDVIHVPLPDRDARKRIAQIWCAQGAPIAPDVDFVAIANRSDGLSGAQVSGICKEAAMCAAREAMAETNRDAREVFRVVRIEMRHFDSAFRMVS